MMLSRGLGGSEDDDGDEDDGEQGDVMRVIMIN